MFVTGRSHFLLSEHPLSFNNVIITLTSARSSACIVELASGILFMSLSLVGDYDLTS